MEEKDENIFLGIKKVNFTMPLVLWHELIEKGKVSDSMDFWVCTAIKERLLKEEDDGK